MGAATIPPVGRYVSAFSVISERTTASRHGPWYVHRETHSSHSSRVAASCAMGSIASGGGW